MYVKMSTTGKPLKPNEESQWMW